MVGETHCGPSPSKAYTSQVLSRDSEHVKITRPSHYPHQIICPTCDSLPHPNEDSSSRKSVETQPQLILNQSPCIQPLPLMYSPCLRPRLNFENLFIPKTLKPVTQSLVTIPRSSCCNYALNIQCDHLSQTCYCTKWCAIGLFKTPNIQN